MGRLRGGSLQQKWYSTAQSKNGVRFWDETTCLCESTTPETARNGPAITLLTGGFPCQPYSSAGKQRGSEDDRALWPEMLRVIQETRPDWIIGENVGGFVNMGLDDCLSDLEGAGYDCQPLVIPACAVNAPHRRDRVWIVARNTKGDRGSQVRRIQKGQDTNTGRVCKDVADTENKRLEGISNNKEGKREGSGELKGGGFTGGINQAWRQWAVEPNVGRVAHGIPSRVDRLKGLGNAIVPQVAAVIMQAINEIEGLSYAD